MFKIVRLNAVCVFTGSYKIQFHHIKYASQFLPIFFPTLPPVPPNYINNTHKWSSLIYIGYRQMLCVGTKYIKIMPHANTQNSLSLEFWVNNIDVAKK